MALTVAAFAQTNMVPVTAPLPQTVSQYWDLIIAAVTPLIVTGVWKLVPKIPKWVLPVSTPVIGILLGLAMNKLASANLGWVDMAKAGALAVFVREVINQAVTQQLQPPTPAPSIPVPPAPKV
jgi:MFS superfamily sulfate permease-like transporter